MVDSTSTHRMAGGVHRGVRRTEPSWTEDSAARAELAPGKQLRAAAPVFFSVPRPVWAVDDDSNSGRKGGAVVVSQSGDWFEELQRLFEEEEGLEVL